MDNSSELALFAELGAAFAGFIATTLWRPPPGRGDSPAFPCRYRRLLVMVISAPSSPSAEVRAGNRALSGG